MSYVIGIDVGTGGAKALLLGADGTVHAAATTEYPLSTPHPQWSEQDPQRWWTATCQSIRALLDQGSVGGDDIVGVGLTGQMHGLVLLDDAGDVLRPAILWNDQRTEAQCDEIHRRVGAQRVLEITGKPALTGFTAPKVLWVREHERDVYDAASTMLLPKDYVRYRMTGARSCDVADASGTSLFDVAARDWSPEMIEALDIPRGWLPEVAESAVVSAHVSAEGAAATGLRAGTPVVAGAGDQAAEAIGCGIVDDDVVSVTVGTSGVVFAAGHTPRVDETGRLHAYCHAVPGQWHLMGVMLSAGGSFRWYRDALGDAELAAAAAQERDAYDLLIDDAATIEPGCEGLVFLPYLTGERTPHPDPTARGAFVGLTLRHGKAAMTRAVLEGVTYGLRDSVDLVRGLGARVDRVRVSGGGARSQMWRQLMADVFKADVVTVNVTQGAAFGAAVLATVGAGIHGDVPGAVRAIVRETDTTVPGPEADRYDEPYARYQALYPALAPHFRAIASGGSDWC